MVPPPTGVDCRARCCPCHGHRRSRRPQPLGGGGDRGPVLGFASRSGCAALVAEVVVTGDTLTFKQTAGQTPRTNAPASYVTLNPGFITDLARKNVRIDVRTASEQNAFGYGALILGIGFIGMLGVALYRVTTGRIPALESKTRTANPVETTVTFADVAGVDEAKEEVKEIVDFLREPSRFSAIGGRIPKGVLLVGPPGTGKTLLARSMAGEAKVPFLFASGSDFVEMYAGVGASRIRKLFKDARRHDSCIIFIDELDAVGRSRGEQLAQPRRARADARTSCWWRWTALRPTRASSSSPRPTGPTFSIRRCCVPAGSIVR